MIKILVYGIKENFAGNYDFSSKNLKNVKVMTLTGLVTKYGVIKIAITF